MPPSRAGPPLHPIGTPCSIIAVAWAGRGVVDCTRDRVAELREGGAQVTEMVMDGEDHFLLFSKRDAVIERIGTWIEEGEAPAEPKRGHRGWLGRSLALP